MNAAIDDLFPTNTTGESENKWEDLGLDSFGVLDNTSFNEPGVGMPPTPYRTGYGGGGGGNDAGGNAG
jgi:hypothetical protein